MTTYWRRDDFVVSPVGIYGAIPNVAVTYFIQPALTLATVYSDSTGVTPITNPQFTDGIGHAFAYMATGIYTITYSGPQIVTLTLPDQEVPPGGGGTSITPFAGVLNGTLDGVNRVFTITNGGTPIAVTPAQITVWDNFPLVLNVGFTISGVHVIFTSAPQVGDTLFSQGYY